MVVLSATAAEKLTALLDAATLDAATSIPGAAFCLISRDGTLIYTHAAGLRSLAEPAIPMTTDSTFWLASCAKAITALAAMQLVEQGKLDLDSMEQCEELFPEGKKAKIITGFEEDGKPIMREKKVRITTRMLLTHTGLLTYFLCLHVILSKPSNHPNKLCYVFSFCYDPQTFSTCCSSTCRK